MLIRSYVQLRGHMVWLRLSLCLSILDSESNTELHTAEAETVGVTGAVPWYRLIPLSMMSARLRQLIADHKSISLPSIDMAVMDIHIS